MDLSLILRSGVATHRVDEVQAAAEQALFDLGLTGKVDPSPAVQTQARLNDVVAQSDADFVVLVDDSFPDLARRIAELWGVRDTADLLISSRYSDDRGTRPKEIRREAERYADRWLARVLTLDTTDVRSPLQMIRKTTAIDLAARGVDFADPIATCVRASVAGWTLREVRRAFWPLFTEQPPTPTAPSARAVLRYWSERNGIDSADYDMRAFNSRLAPQRAWQRRRHAATFELTRPYLGRDVLNVGAGSGRLSLDMPGSVSIDIVHAKLRYMRRYAVNPAATASIFQLPFPDESFDCVVCCEVIEHVERDPSPVAELIRVLRPGGRLVLSTPDYGTPVWPTIEKMYAAVQPKGYADEHITHYTEQSFVQEVEGFGLKCVQLNKVFRSILVGAFE